MERIDKILSNMGFGTRKEVKKIIKSNEVTVNGEIIKNFDEKIDETKDKITVFGNELVYKKYVYLMLNKPQGYVSATEDYKFPTVTQIVANDYSNFDVFPVGRLDIDTEGLLILSNDGQFGHQVTSPKHHIAKKYFAKTEREITEDDIKEFAKGMDLGDFTAMPSTLEKTDDGAIVTIYEGKFHQVKRMFEKTSNKVLYLKRLQIGNLKLDKQLSLGDYRELSEQEIALIYE